MEDMPVLDMAELVEIQARGKELYEKASLQFHEGERIYRLAQGTYAGEGAWQETWKGCPASWPKAWQLISNGYVDAADVLRGSTDTAQACAQPCSISEALTLAWSNELEDAFAPHPIGQAVLDAIDAAADELDSRVQEEFPSGTGVFRIDEDGDYVSERDWKEIWALHPGWWEEAWVLADNGMYSAREVAGMTVGEIAKAYSDPEFCPEIAFYTEAE